jgi:hypothetical protein
MIWQAFGAILRQATILQMEKSKFTETEKILTGEQQSQEQAHHFLWYQGDCSQRFRPGRPNSSFRILLWHFTATAWKCAKNWLLHHDNAQSHTSFSTGNFWPKTTRLCPPTHPTCPIWPFANFLFSAIFMQLRYEAESQTVLKTLTEHDFQDAFKIY